MKNRVQQTQYLDCECGSKTPFFFSRPLTMWEVALLTVVCDGCGSQWSIKLKGYLPDPKSFQIAAKCLNATPKLFKIREKKK